MRLSGSCLCGNVTYQCSAEPVLSIVCHCKDCQRSSGAGYAPLFFVEADTIAIQGDVRYYDSKGGSGKNISRGFCPECGSQLFGKLDLFPQWVQVRAGTLDDANAFVAQAHIYTRHAAAWDVIAPDAIAFADAAPISS